jgi:hypothetical protein
MLDGLVYTFVFKPWKEFKNLEFSMTCLDSPTHVGGPRSRLRPADRRSGRHRQSLDPLHRNVQPRDARSRDTDLR